MPLFTCLDHNMFRVGSYPKGLNPVRMLRVPGCMERGGKFYGEAKIFLFRTEPGSFIVLTGTVGGRKKKWLYYTFHKHPLEVSLYL